ncbi:MAG: acyl-CoA dehydrogenase family protein [Dehalococcoidia bacterium]|nr:acyl-CoA dehydrogenase family protein [Dehalococcoidia bacterium]
MTAAASDLLASAQALAPAVRAAGDRIEGGRQLPPDIVDLLRDAGLFHLAVPRAYGGVEADPVEASRIVEEISAADGSAGWCVMLGMQAGLYCGFLPPEVAGAVLGEGGIFAGTARPIGRARPAHHDGVEGYRISGRWPFASGSSHATAFTGEALLYEDSSDTPTKNEDGSDRVVAFFVPRDEVTIHDTWDTTGLRGTASNDFEVDDAFVPADHVFDFSRPRHDWALFRCPALIFMNHGAQALGLGRAALEAARDVFTSKRGWGGVPLQEVGRVQEAYALAMARYESAHTYYYECGEALWRDVLASGAEGAPELRAKARLAASHAVTDSLGVVDSLHRACATTAIQRSNALDRIFRDMHTAAAHVMVGPLVYEAAGRVLLGRPADFPLF